MNRSEIELLIQHNKIEQAFRILDKARTPIEPKTKKAILTIRRRYNKIKDEKRAGIIDDKDFRLEENTIYYSFLEIIEDLFEGKREPIGMGFCIRTGKKIPLNPDRPLSAEAYQEWRYYSNFEYPEKFCHFTGEPTHGENSYAYPILRKNWKEAKKHFS